MVFEMHSYMASGMTSAEILEDSPTCGGDEDKGHIWLGEWQLDQLAAKLFEANIRIALSHHPISWLVEAEDPSLRTRFQAEFEVLLHGHEHQLWVETPQSDHLHVAAGAVLDKPDSALGYNIVRANSNSAHQIQ